MRSIGTRLHRLAPMALLYLGRVGVAGLGLVVLPWLGRLMRPAEFGMATTVLALQALMVVLDLGMSVNLIREVPVCQSGAERRLLMRHTEAVLLRAYATLAVVVIALSMAGVLPLGPLACSLAVVSVLCVVWQNLLASAFIGQQLYTASTASQFFSLLARHACALVIVAGFGGTVLAFLAGQVVGAGLVLVVSRRLFARANADATGLARAPATSAINLAMMIYTSASALALQMDKVLLSGFASPTATGPYFLASTLSLVPITFLASPVSQFVQPKLIQGLTTGQEATARVWTLRLTLAIVVLAVLPGVAGAQAAGWLVPFWLHNPALQGPVVGYTRILMPGAAIGALGLVPATILIARRDYRAMAAISVTLTILVLGAAAILARHGALESLCLAYAVYHVAAAALLWLRVIQIEPGVLARRPTRTTAGAAP